MRLLTLLFALLAATGYSQIEYQPLFCHLMEVNQEWDQMNADSEDLEKEMSFENDVERIQMHLRLVEKHLRAKDVSLLNELQRNNREKCLDVLRKYASDVVFPQNRYHKERIPYFIDHRGVHCAVGHLIMSTGYGDFAQQVHKENNYLYLGELQEIYPEIEFWAEENGFTPKELAWIQPGYSPCVTDCSEEMFIICSGGVGSEESYTYTWSNGETGFHIDNACPGQAISCIVLDSLGQEIPSNNCSMIAGESGLFVGTNSIVLPETSGAIMEITSIATDSDECTGEATVTVLNNVVTDTPQWESSGQSGSTATNLCEGWHYVTINSGVYETYECQTTDSIYISLSDQICEIHPGINNEYELPNPVNLRTFDLGETDALIESGTLLQYNDEDQTATLTAHFTSVTDSSAGWDLELQLTSGMNWEEWSTQSFPTSYRDDTETVIDEYLAWKYYIVSCGTLNGWGNWEGSHLNLAHAPENNFYGFELGMNSNGWNSGFGAKVWLTATGQVYNTETSTIESVLAQLSLHMDIDECMETVIETEPENCEPFSAGSDIFMCDLCEWNTQLGAALPCSTTGEWSLIQGAGTFEDITNPNSFLELDGYGIHILEWSAECNDELLLDTVAVYLFADSFFPRNAGVDLFVNYCEGDSVQLNGEIPQPPLMAFWVQEDGCPVEFSNVDDPNSMVYGLLPGVYTFSWNLPISCSCPVYDQVTVTVTGCEGGIELCEPSLSGCTLPFATNYNPSAIEDTGNCEFDFSICDCLGNVHSPYAYLQLGDGIPNNAVNLDFNCELWGYDCGDIENTSNGDFEVCDGNLPAMYGCTDNVEERSSTGLNIYPNPTGGIMYITLQGFGNDINLEIYNSIGALVHKEHANSSHVRLDLSKFLDNGVYSIRAFNDDFILAKRIILEK